MRTMPITSDRNNPVYQEKTKWERLLLNEETRDENDQPCNIFGLYDFAEGCIRFDIEYFRLVPISDEPVYPSKEVLHEIIRDLLKSKHGRNVNFV